MGSAVYPWVGKPREEVHLGPKMGLGSSGQGIPRYLECGPEEDWGYGYRRPGYLTPWDTAGTGPEWNLSKHRAQGRGHQYNDVSSVCKFHEGRAGVNLIY